jgi:nucleoside-diphosphate-sugar epimerase
MTQPLSALIIGCGYVGSRLKTLLTEKNWTVFSARRSSQPGHTNIIIDVSSEFSLPHRYDVIFYMVSAGAYNQQAYQNAYSLGVYNTLQAIRKSGQNPRVIHVSSTSVFSECNGGMVTEESPTKVNSFSVDAILNGEHQISTSGYESSILRLSGIYGPDRFHLLDQIKAGSASLKKEPVISNRIHVEDCIGALYHLATIPHPDPIYIGTDSEPTPYNEVIQWLAKKLKVDPVATAAEETTSVHMSNKRCSNSKLLRSGYRFRFPNYRDGFLTAL